MFPIITTIILIVILVIIMPEILALVAKIKFANGNPAAALRCFAVANRMGRLDIFFCVTVRPSLQKLYSPRHPLIQKNLRKKNESRLCLPFANGSAATLTLLLK